MIESKENSKIKEYVKLLSKKSYREKTGRFALEGVRIVYDALCFKAELDEILISEECLKKIKNTKFSAILNYRYDLISSRIAKSISNVENSQEVFAISKKLPNLKVEQIKKTDRLLALFGIKDPGNLGTLIRSACAFNFCKIVLASNCCDIYNSKVVRGSMGAIFKTRFLECSNFLGLLDFLKDMEMNVFASVVEGNVEPLRSLKGKKGMLIVGNEAVGLPQEVLEKCRKVTIKMSNNSESLNAAVAGSILMHELSKEE